MSKLQIFENPEFGDIRMIEIDGVPYAVGIDIARALGYAAPSKAVIDRCEGITKAVIPSYNQHGAEVMQETNVIPESDIYRLIFGSKLEGAKKFQAWVFEEVLPSIRKTGMYATPETAERLMNDPDFLIRALEEIKAVRAKNAALEAENTQMRPKARFADAVACAETDIPVGDLAKILRGNGVDIGQNRLFAWMRAHEYLMQSRGNGVDIGQNRLFAWMRANEYLMCYKGSGWNAPTQMAMDLGLFRVTETTTTRADGRVHLNRVTMVTGKGQQYFVNMLLQEEDGALPRIMLDEQAWARDIVRTQDLGDMPMRALTCVARHYLEQGLGTDAVRERLNALYNKGSHCGFIDISERILKEAGKRGLLYITSIPVTRRELQAIRGIDGIRRQRVAFALLALAKYQNHAHGENHDWVSFRHKDVFAMANVKVSVNEQYLLLNDLKSMGLLKYNRRVDNLDVRVLYTDHEGPAVMEIHDMRNLGHQYMRHWGGRFVECRDCGAVVPRKSPRQMYCVDCARLENAKRSQAFYNKKIGIAA
ncbi:MAG: phage antirepressor KilAC domain-containing protein [Oscillospiraceae bacterium]|nr:phage antirepressor KilAC domain-containing protein [Oscillospiraceae bacterium]